MRRPGLPLIWLSAVVMLALGPAASQVRRADRTKVAPVTGEQAEQVTAAQARALENLLTELLSADVLEATPTTQPTSGGPGATPQGPRLELVEITPSLERQLTGALAGQAGIEQVIGSDGAILAFPGMIRQVDATGEEVQLKAFALAGKRLRYDPSKKMFAGTIWLGVNEIVPGRRARDLVTPVDFEILDADSAMPSRVRVSKTGSPYSQVQLQLTAALEGSAVKILSSIAPDPISLDLPLNPALILESGNTSVEGLGLGTSQINISVFGLPSPKDRIVTLSTSSGYLDTTQLQLSENGTASTTLRSEDVGRAVVTASSRGLGQTSISVDYRLPVITFLASVLGGLAGGAIRLGANTRRRPWRIATALLISVLLGILVFALYAIGVNVLPITPSVTVGAVLVFAVSGLGSFLGPRVLDSR